jgi:hypothetical protein
VPSSPSTKSIAWIFLIGAFLTGGAVGFVTDRAINLSRPRRGPMDERAMRDSLARELHLSDAQRRSVDSIYDWRRARNKELMDSVSPSFDAVRDSARVLLMKSLDPQQQADFRKIIDRLQKADSVRRTRNGRR